LKFQNFKKVFFLDDEPLKNTFRKAFSSIEETLHEK
jgi:hypothetical protein